MSENTNNIPAKSGTTNDLSALDVRSEEVQEIIGRPPHWLVRWGITAFFGVLGLVLLSAAVIKYPEVIHAPLRLTAVDAPQSLESWINGKLVRIIVENNTHVEQGGCWPGWKVQPAMKRCLRLSETVEEMRSVVTGTEIPRNLTGLDIGQFANLGEIQTCVSGIRAGLARVCLVPAWWVLPPPAGDSYEGTGLYKRFAGDNCTQQKSIQQEDYHLAQREVEIQRRLAEDGHIAPIELARSEAELSSRQLPLQQTESAIINNFVSQIAKEREIMELDKRMEEQHSVFHAGAEQSSEV
jgi:hypothetical protein